MNRVYVCAKLGGTPEEVISNIDRALTIGAALYADEGVIPVVPHTLALMLDDGDEVAREAGMAYALELLESCDELRYYDNPTAGMARETKRAHELGIKISDYRYQPGGCYA